MLGHLDIFVLVRLIVGAGVTLLVTIHWQVMGALVSVVTATVLAHIEASGQPLARLVYLPSNDTLDPDKLKLTKVIEDILCNCSRMVSLMKIKFELINLQKMPQKIFSFFMSDTLFQSTKSYVHSNILVFQQMGKPLFILCQATL